MADSGLIHGVFMDLSHGIYHIEVIGRMIIVELCSGFNEYTVVKYNNDMKAIIEGFSGDEFTILIKSFEFTGGTPEAFRISNEFNKWVNTQNLLGKAIVHKSNILVDIAREQESALAEQNIAEFDNENGAIEWLQSLS